MHPRSTPPRTRSSDAKEPGVAATGRDSTSDIAADFNNVLTVILGNAELLAADHAADEPVSAVLEEIRKAAIRGSDLVRQLQRLSPAETG